MASTIFLTLAGLAIIGLTLSDVFKTVVEPGGSDAFLGVARRLTYWLLPIWKRFAGQLTGMFAPLILVASYVVWACLLSVGFGLLAFAAKNEFHPHLKSFWDATYIAASSIVTIGLSSTSTTGAARWIVVGAGFCGLGVMTLAVTYLLLVQGSVSTRDKGIIKLNTSAGEPPSALALLENYSQIRNTDQLPEMMRDARDWCATVRQSHTSHPSLIYFQTIGAGAGWPAALGAMLDLAMLCETWLEGDQLHGPGVLLAAEARGMAQNLARLVGLTPRLPDTPEPALREIENRLSAAGYALKPQIDFDSFARARSQAQACIAAMAEHLGKPTTPLIPMDGM